jgi:hypothetical protein
VTVGMVVIGTAQVEMGDFSPGVESIEVKGTAEELEGSVMVGRVMIGAAEVDMGGLKPGL